MILDNFKNNSSQNNSFQSTDFQSNRFSAEVLNRIRLIAIIGQLLLIAFAVTYLGIQLPFNWLALFVGTEVILQFYATHRVKQTKAISSLELFVHILGDSLILSGLIYFSGGANNPFIYLLLIAIALGTLMLTARYLLLVSITQVSLYSLLNIYQRPLELGDSSPLASFHLHLAGMWVNFALTVILIASFGLLVRYSLSKQNKQIQRLREKQLKDEQILSIGIMSASAAHELGTPLGTMAIVVDDLVHQVDKSEALFNDMKILEKEIKRCRDIIGSLGEKSELTREQLLHQEQHVDVNLKKQLLSITENWLVYRPQIELTQQWNNNFDGVLNKFPISVEQAVINLLDNAADASLENNHRHVRINYSIESLNNQTQTIIEITDFGTGLTREKREKLGSNIQLSNKSDGLGWGLFLSNASIERAGGEVHLLESDTGGTLTRITLPIEISS